MKHISKITGISRSHDGILVKCENLATFFMTSDERASMRPRVGLYAHINDRIIVAVNDTGDFDTGSESTVEFTIDPAPAPDLDPDSDTDPDPNPDLDSA